MSRFAIDSGSPIPGKMTSNLSKIDERRHLVTR